MEKSDIFDQLKSHLCDLFKLPEERIIPEAKLSDDLDLDSIDAIDLIIKLQEMTGRKFKATEFRTVRTVQDVVDKVYALARVADA